MSDCFAMLHLGQGSSSELQSGPSHCNPRTIGPADDATPRTAARYTARPELLERGVLMSVRFARPALASVAVLLGALIAPAGCQSETPLPAGVPKGAALLAEAVGPIGERDVNPEPPWEVETDGMLYLRNVNTGQVISRPVKAGQTLKVYPGWVSVGGSQVDKATGRTLPQKFVKERIVARFEPGKRYEVYYRPGLFGEALAKANGGATSRPATDPM